MSQRPLILRFRPPVAGLLTAGVAVALLVGGGSLAATTKAAPKKAAPKPKSTSVTIATVGDRVIDDIDIRLAADALAYDPARKRNPEAWRRSLLDRCVDRELLAQEAERRGLANDPAVKAKLAEREFSILLREVERRDLVPSLAPKPEELPDLRRRGGYRLLDLLYIFLPQESEGPDNAALARRIVDRVKAGAAFDSLARLYSAHPPSRTAGGRVGWVLVKELNTSARGDLMGASAGDVLGPYTVAVGFEIFKVAATRELSDDSLTTVATVDRKRGMVSNHEEAVLKKYHFALDPAQVKPLLFAVASETPDSILKSLGPDGTRPEKGVRPAIGILARCDGDSVGFRDVLRVTPPVIGDAGRMRIRDEMSLRDLCARVLVPRLVVRDARERGFHKDPAVARELRMSREEVLTRAMVARARPSAPDSATLRVYFDRVRHRYVRPAATVADVAIFPSAESAVETMGRIRQGMRADSLYSAMSFIEQPRATPFTLYPGHFGRLTLSKTGADSLTRAVQGRSPGEFAPVVSTIQGYAMARVHSVEAERPETFEDSYARVLGDWADERTDEWVREQLTRLRAKTPVRVVPGRLEAVKLASVSSSTAGGTR